jgi:histidinol-phosphatase
VCAVVSAPALGHRWWAARGSGAFRDGNRLAVSKVASLEDATVSASYARDLARIEPRVWHARGFGDFWQHMLVAEGAADAAVDAELAIWDYSAIVPIVEEAGGRVTTLDGRAPEPGAQVVSSNGALHAGVLSAVAG